MLARPMPPGTSEAPQPHSPGDDAATLRSLDEQAERCRRLAGATYDRKTTDALTAMAESFEASADALRPPRLAG